ncbi:MAG: hypothetical protein K8F52_01190 [Candidatus Scalindua rubra]|uniref:Uncharacterized protein n=1 Tax=Candidatus Scalindua brodae TaxID=237368 RepID=A0A0B0EU28_9BACT|nr:MAG: hypothetical protein SCABRO_00013 [Candidatus Scalindua brodae]MBZ0107256.1 hypothetical protein [Candidatus Scalindua rubra]TWU31696.1 hypothetical protein S225a_20870 [Candidatus Brocadiaceae bacterium S225]
MDIRNTNNSQIITESFIKGMAKKNNPTLLALNNKSAKLPFGRVLNNELGGANSPHTLRRPAKHFMPLNNSRINRYPETLFKSRDVNKPSKSSIIEQYKTYKEDQLMSNPGGDNFFLSKTGEVIDNNYDHSRITKRVGKDLSDAGNNLLNAVKDLGIGAKIKYVDKHGNIQDGRKVGLAGTVVNFFKDVASGLSFGLYSPEGEVRPQGGAGRVKHLFKKIFKDALVGDIVKGVPKSVIHIGEDIMFAGLNAVEAVPDATIGNFKAGRKVTTAVFDNTQVILDFVTDVIPGGDASIRTRSFELAKGLKGLPIINNLTTPEGNQDEKEWRYVRNTSFRKVIETIPSLMPFRI